MGAHQAVLKNHHISQFFFGVKQCKSLVILRDFPLRVSWFGLVVQWPLLNEPNCCGRNTNLKSGEVRKYGNMDGYYDVYMYDCMICVDLSFQTVCWFMLYIIVILIHGIYWNVLKYIELWYWNMFFQKWNHQTKTQNQSKLSIIFIDTLWWPQFSWISREDGCGSGAGTRGASQFFFWEETCEILLSFVAVFFSWSIFFCNKNNSQQSYFDTSPGWMHHKRWFVTYNQIDSVKRMRKELLMAEPWRLRPLRLRWRSHGRDGKWLGVEFGNLVGWFVST